MTLFFISAWPVFAYSGPLRPPMWGGEPYKTNPEAVVATATANGGDAAYRGTSPSTPQQSVADSAQMTGRTPEMEPDIDVKVTATIFHIIDDDTEEYATTRFEFKAAAAVKVNDERLYIVSQEALEDEIWNIAPDEVKNIVEKIESNVAEKAFNFLKARRELLDVLKTMKVEVAWEKVVYKDEYEDDYYDDP